ncbi:unnamed protein product [Dicrocoelium dendriticum]|nr:unnamed protein product [Dicrocoelium dendriticum]
MTTNATWLTFKMLREYVKHEKLWHGHFVDRDGSVKPVNLMVVIQYVFMNLPLIVTMGVVLALVTLFLSVYAMFHCWLVLTNQTGYEYAAANRKSQSSRSSMPLAPSTQHDQLTMSWSSRVLVTRPHRPYDRGMLANISDAFGYRIAASLREIQRRLPPQLEFKTR